MENQRGHSFRKSEGKSIWPPGQGVDRRRFLKLGLLAALPFMSASLHLPKAFAYEGQKRLLSFYNTHTGEALSTLYWESGEYLKPSLSDINHILRDHRTNEVMSMDLGLLDLLHAIHLKVGTQEPFHIISGYRSARTNAFLCNQNRGVVKNSLHLYGKAADIRLPGYELSSLRRVAVNLRAGGVGYYPQSDFLHIDVGRVRNW
jgi:uncharacterized protein YcbK (DUF882 family)